MKPPAIDWPAEAGKLLDRFEQNLAWYRPDTLTEDQRTNIKLCQANISEARKLIALYRDPEIATLVAEAVYRGAVAGEQQMMPWYTHRAGIPRQGGFSPKPRIEKRQHTRRERIALLWRRLPKTRRTAAGVQDLWALEYPEVKVPSENTILADLREITSAKR